MSFQLIGVHLRKRDFEEMHFWDLLKAPLTLETNATQIQAVREMLRINLNIICALHNEVKLGGN